MESLTDQVRTLNTEGSVDNVLSLGQVEEAMAALFPPILDLDKTAAIDHFDDIKFQRISRLLKKMGKPDWSLRPRTYAVLRMAHRVDVMHAFVLEGLYDISLPYSEKTLPDALKNTSARSKFLELQSLVLTGPGADLESGAGEHAYFKHDANVPFERVKALGSGGFGMVDQVRSRLSLNEYARKRMPRGRTFKRDKQAVADFERELATLKRLSHRHLVKFVGSYTDPKCVCIIMSPVADCNLAEYLQADPFPEERRSSIRSFYGCLASALSYLRANRLRHKDIKPANVLIHGDNVLLTDFGTALDWSERDRSTTKNKPTALSIPYCAPEVADWEPRDSSSDTWSLGCVFLEMTSVLRGETVSGMRKFFQENGNLKLYVRTNPDGAQLWMKRLRTLGGLQSDNKPLEWITEMLKINREERPEAAELATRINAVDGPHSFCGPCCAENVDDTDISDDVSEVGEEMDSFIDLHVESHTRSQAAVLEVAKSPVPLEGHQPENVQVATGTLMEHHVPSMAGSEPAMTNDAEQEPSELDPTQDTLYNTPEEEERAIQLLLERGADAEEEDFDGNSELPWAIFNEHEAVVRLLVRKGADLDAMIYNGRPALHEAIRLRRESVVRLLLATGASVKLEDYHGDTALFRATASENEDIMRMLVEHGADIESTVVYGNRFLHFAAGTGRTELTRLLIDKGVNLETLSQRGETALLLALKHGHEGPARLLVERGANLDTETNYRTTPLMAAVSSCSEGMVRALIEKGAKVNARASDGGTALLWAASCGKEAMVRLLIEKGANVAARSHFGQIAVLVAAERGHAEIVRLLLEKATKIRAKTCTLETVMEVALSNGADAVIRLLLDMGADLQSMPADQVTKVLHETVKNDHGGIIPLLREKGADINMKLARDGQTALHNAIEEGHEAVTRVLIHNGADVNATTSKGQTALRQAIDTCQWETAELLLENGANLKSMPVAEIEAALRGAAESGREGLARLVLEKGPPLFTMTGYNCQGGHVPLFEALREGHFSIAELLLTKRAKHKSLSAFDFHDALHWAASGGHQTMMRVAIEHYVDLEKEVEGMRALHEAAKGGHENAVKQLIKAGADINAKSEKEGRTPLHWAAVGGHAKVVNFLVQQKSINLKARTKAGKSAVEEATLAGYDFEQLLQEARKK